jgi:transcriptional regulator with XRE-family HTH domain
MLGRLVEEKTRRLGISQREAARQIGVSATTLAAVSAGRPLEVNTAYLICSWLGVPLEAAVNRIPADKNLAVQITILLKAAPELEEIFSIAAKEVETGTLSSDDFREILEFAAFKIQQRRERLKYEQSGDNLPGRGDN